MTVPQGGYGNGLLFFSTPLFEALRRFPYGAEKGEKIWIKMGHGVECMFNVDDWPETVLVAFRPVDGAVIMEWVEYLLQTWADLDRWPDAPGAERAPEGWIIKKIEMAEIKEKTRKKLLHGSSVCRNPWL